MADGPALAAATELARKNDARIPGESEEYRRARTALLAEEIELRRHIERVAARRRALPGGEVPVDYEFTGEDGRKVRLSEMFGESDTLVTYIWMYGPGRERPCPMCTAFLGSLEGTPGTSCSACRSPSSASRRSSGSSPSRRSGAGEPEVLLVRGQLRRTTAAKARTARTGRRSTCSSATPTARSACSGATRWGGDRRPRPGPARRARPDADVDDLRHDARRTRPAGTGSRRS